MSTYLQGVDEYIPQIQQFQPDFNFYANALQYKQSKYDAAREQIADVYNSILNNPMVRESDIAKREEFFKQIDSDIKKIAHMDLSLRQNQNAATNVFSQLLNDKNIAHDMVFTKKVQSIMSEDENLRGDKRRWDGNVQLAQYYTQAYQEADDQKALTMQAPHYIYRADIGEDVANMLAEGKLKFDVVNETPYQQKVDAQGNPVYKTNADGTKTPVMEQSSWIIRQKNGMLSEPYLQSILLGKYANNSDVNEYYTAQAELNRLAFISNNKEKYGSREAAEQAYIEQAMQGLDEAWVKSESAEKDNVANQQARVDAIAKDVQTAQKNSDSGIFDYDEYQRLLQDESETLEGMKQTYQYTSETAKALQDRMDGNITGSVVDRILGGNLMKQAIADGAKAASMQGYELSYKENPYVMEQIRFNNQVSLEKMKMNFEAKKFSAQAELDLKKEMIKAGLYNQDQDAITGPRSSVHNEAGTQVSDKKFGGTYVTDYWDEVNSGYLENSGITTMEKNIVKDQLNHLKSIINNSESEEYKKTIAKEAFVSAMLNSMDEDDAEALTKKYGHNYNKLYEAIKDRNIDFVSGISAYRIDNLYHTLQTSTSKLGNITSANISQLQENLETKLASYKKALSDDRINLKSALDKFEKGSYEWNVIRAYAGISKGQQSDSWDGRLANYDEFWKCCKSYGMSEYEINEAWDTKRENKNSASNIFGKAFDNILPYTDYAKWSNALRGADSRLATGVSGNVTNQAYDASRKMIIEYLSDALGASSVTCYEGRPKENGDDNDDDVKKMAEDLMAKLNNRQDTESTAKINYGYIFLPIVDSDPSRCGFYFFDADEDDQEKQRAFTVTVNKGDISETQLAQMMKNDWAREYLYMHNEMKVPMPNPESSCVIKFENGVIHATGTMQTWNENTHKVEKKTWNVVKSDPYALFNEVIAKDAAEYKKIQSKKKK